MQENVIKERLETKSAADKLSGNSYQSSPELKMEKIQAGTAFDRSNRKLSVFTTVECYYRVLDGSKGPRESE